MFKRFIHQFTVMTVLAFSVATFSYAKVDYQVEPQTQVIAVAEQLEQFGVLKQKDNGYLYVEVSREYIEKILPLIDAPGKLTAPRHCVSKKGIGPHVSVMYEDEQILNEIWEIAELGQVFTFKVKELRTVKINRDNKIKKIWLLAVEAPELERLRESYGLSSRLKGHDFHITIATQVPGKPQAEQDDPTQKTERKSRETKEAEMEIYQEAA